MSTDRPFFQLLGTVLLSGVWSHHETLNRLRIALGRRGGAAWVTDLVQRIFQAFGEQPPPPRLAQLVAFFESDQQTLELVGSWQEHPGVSLLQLPPPVMSPAPSIPPSWALPTITTPGALADWLELEPQQLDWFADCHSLERRAGSERLRHYRYRWISKRGGSARLLEAPKQRLKSLQRKILADILNRIEPHRAARGFRAGGSVVSYAAPHVGRHFVLRIDLRDFFPSVRSSRVHALFRTVGYPENVVRLLTGLCTNSTPLAVIDAAPSLEEIKMREDARRLLGAPHLPQGAPTSPALANLCAWRLDCRLAGLARSAGAEYTRYADDLLFSGHRRLFRRLADFRVLVLAIVLDEGFSIRNRKTRLMTNGHRQQAGGVVLNERVNVPRDQYDRLKAILYNCIRYGPVSQNRSAHPSFREHLRGRIAYFASINRTRGDRLLKLFEQIEWPA